MFNHKASGTLGKIKKYSEQALELCSNTLSNINSISNAHWIKNLDLKSPDWEDALTALKTLFNLPQFFFTLYDYCKAKNKNLTQYGMLATVSYNIGLGLFFTILGAFSVAVSPYIYVAWTCFNLTRRFSCTARHGYLWYEANQCYKTASSDDPYKESYAVIAKQHKSAFFNALRGSVFSLIAASISIPLLLIPKTAVIFTSLAAGFNLFMLGFGIARRVIPYLKKSPTKIHYEKIYQKSDEVTYKSVNTLNYKPHYKKNDDNDLLSKHLNLIDDEPENRMKHSEFSNEIRQPLFVKSTHALTRIVTKTFNLNNYKEYLRTEIINKHNSLIVNLDKKSHLYVRSNINSKIKLLKMLQDSLNNEEEIKQQINALVETNASSKTPKNIDALHDEALRIFRSYKNDSVNHYKKHVKAAHLSLFKNKSDTMQLHLLVKKYQKHRTKDLLKAAFNQKNLAVKLNSSSLSPSS